MQAGLLREKLVFKESVDVVTPSGFKKKDFRDILTARAYKKRSSGAEKLQAKELFNSVSLTFLLRYNPLIKDTQIVTYNGNDYTISFLDRNTKDSTLEIILNKKDK